MYQHTKNQFIPLILWDKANFRVLWPVSKPIFDHPHLKISMNLHQHAKSQAFSSLCSSDVVDLKILQSDWPRAFWYISQELDFSQIWDLCKNTANNINFPYRLQSYIWSTFGPFQIISKCSFQEKTTFVLCPYEEMSPHYKLHIETLSFNLCHFLIFQ